MSDMPPPPPDDSGWSSQPPPPPGPAPQSSQSAKGWATLGTGEGVELAGAGSRLGARIIDSIILTIVSFILVAAGVLALVGLDIEDADTEDELAEGSGVFLGIVLAVFAIGLLYEVALIATRGQTLGKMATRIRVVRADNGLVPGWGKSFGRWLVPAVFGIAGIYIPFVGLIALLVYLWILWDRVRQGLHDKAAGTLVVKV